MPQRFLRPGITTSDGWNAVSFGAQSLYIRILTLVDDYGRYDGRMAILHAHCFALRPDIDSQQTAGFRRELQENGLLHIYVVAGKEFVQLSKWQERARGKSKYPDPPAISNCNPQDSAGFRSGKTLPSPSPSPSPSRASADGLPFESEHFTKTWEDWKTHRKEKRKPLTKKSVELQFKNLSEMGELRAILAINHSIANGYEGIYEPKEQQNGSHKSTESTRNIGTANEGSAHLYDLTAIKKRREAKLLDAQRPTANGDA